MVEKIENYTKPAAVNPWVAELEGFVAGDAFAEVITPNERKDKETGEVTRSISGTKARIQDAAREHGLTARVAEETEQADGTVRVVFTLTPAQKRTPRTSAEAAPAVEDAGKGK